MPATVRIEFVQDWNPTRSSPENTYTAQFEYTAEGGRTETWSWYIGERNQNERSNLLYRIQRELEKDGWKWENTIGDILVMGGRPWTPLSQARVSSIMGSLRV